MKVLYQFYVVLCFVVYVWVELYYVIVFCLFGMVQGGIVCVEQCIYVGVVFGLLGDVDVVGVGYCEIFVVGGVGYCVVDVFGQYDWCYWCLWLGYYGNEFVVVEVFYYDVFVGECVDVGGDFVQVQIVVWVFLGVVDQFEVIDVDEQYCYLLVFGCFVDCLCYVFVQCVVCEQVGQWIDVCLQVLQFLFVQLGGDVEVYDYIDFVVGVVEVGV